MLSNTSEAFPITVKEQIIRIRLYIRQGKKV